LVGRRFPSTSRGRASPPSPAAGPITSYCGLYHFGVKVGDSDDELRSVLTRLREADVPIVGTSDHVVTHSICVHDPDGNEVELYVDVPGVDRRSSPEMLISAPRALTL
jgi:catechol-2,3-dioxygenase